MSQAGQTGQAVVDALDDAFKGQQGQQLETQLMTEFETFERSDDE